MKGILNRLSNTKVFKARGKSLKFFYHKLSGKYLVQFGSGAPSGTPKAFIYIDYAATTATTIVYFDVNGTWTALTIS